MKFPKIHIQMKNKYLSTENKIKATIGGFFLLDYRARDT